MLHVLDPAERELARRPGRRCSWIPESALAVPATVADVRAAYRKTVTKAIAEWREQLAAAGASYEVVSTDAPFGVPLRRAFAARQQMP